MLKILGYILLALVGSALALVLILALDPVTRAAYRDGSGQLASGSFLGVSVGDPAERGVRRLEELGLDLDRVERGGACFYENYAESYRIFVMKDRTWRKGTVCLAADAGGRIHKIEWWFGLIWAP